MKTTPDLTAAVETAAARFANAQAPGSWDQLTAMQKHIVREAVAPVVAAVAPMIYDQGYAAGEKAGADAARLIESAMFDLEGDQS